jgi:hypothetical protein
MHSRPWSLLNAVTFSALMLFSNFATAERFDKRDLPPELTDWADWVLDRTPDYVCPVVDGEIVCRWPGALELILDTGGGQFSQQVLVDRDIYLVLPGNFANWPQNVTVDGRPAVVIEQLEEPVVRLSPGTHRISGELLWNKLPEGIKIPAEVALVSLEVQGQKIPFPRRDENGLLWLQSSTSNTDESEKLDLEVMRKIRDGIPLSISTQIVIRASGKSREVNLGRALIPDTTPVSVEADIPARVDKEGNLSLQVRAGTHTVTIVARTASSPEELLGPTHEAPWPEDEIWVWQANEKLRQVTVTGPPGIDPSRTNLPNRWRGFPAYLVGPNAKFVITTSRRGEPEPPPDKLTLSRELWMDLDGKGFTVRDNLRGTLNRTWRLDLEPPGVLGHASVNGVDQLITKNPANRQPGVELRQGNLSMTAEWRIEEGSKELPAVGWSEAVQELDTTVHLPPGWKLLSARGVDELPGTWWDKWDLFGFFFVLIVSLTIGKLTRWYFGVIALITLVLSHHEQGAPFAVWAALLVSLGLLKVLPKGKLRFAGKVLWWGSVLWLVVVLVPFSVTQVRLGMFPQVGEYESDAGRPDFASMINNVPVLMNQFEEKDISALAGNVAQAEMMMDEESGELDRKPMKKRKMAQEQTAQQVVRQISDGLASSSGLSLDKRGWTGGKKANYRSALQQDPKAVVQTGPGVPNWRWNNWRLGWSGPVDKSQHIELYLLGPKTNLILSILRVLLLVLLGLRIVLESKNLDGDPPQARNKKTTKPKAKSDKKVAAASAATVLALALTMPSTGIAEQTPVPSILDELSEKLTRPDECQPDCVSTSSMKIDVENATISLTAQVHAGSLGSWRMPGPAKNWVPKTVEINGRPTIAISLRQSGFLHVRLEQGRHEITVTGPLPTNGTLTLELGDKPKYVSANAPGFTVEGLREDGHAEGSIQITRKAASETGADNSDFEEGSYPPWLEVTRTLDLGIPWLVHTTVTRISPIGSPFLVRIPLLPGESVTESELQVEDNMVVLSLGRDDTEISWSSTLTEMPKLKLTAPSNVPWSEVWKLRCSPVWQCDFKGLAPIHRKPRGNFEPTFKPWPGEALFLTLTRPGGMEGQSTTIDSAKLDLSPGIRLVKASLKLAVRSSRGGALEITLPKGAAVQELRVNNAKQPYRQNGKKLAVTLQTGRQMIEIDWQQPGGITVRYQTPDVRIDGRAANVSVVVNLPSDRWLLWAGGPTWGPAILFWGFLLTVLIAGLILGRIKLSPLKSWQWMLLALGLTQVPVPVALIIVGWFLALAWRADQPPENFVVHNAIQILLGVWTLVAAGCLVGAVYDGLAVQPDMQVQGGGSSNTYLVWYLDHIENTLPRPWIISVPLLVWKLIMLGWALWLAASIVKWGPWAWRSFSAQTLWRKNPNPRQVRQRSARVHPRVAAQQAEQAAREAVAKQEKPPADSEPES